MAGALGVAALSVAILTPAPLLLEPVGQHTTGQLQTVDSLTVIARQPAADQPMTPHFAVALGAYMSSFWVVNEGPPVVPPHGSATLCPGRPECRVDAQRRPGVGPVRPVRQTRHDQHCALVRRHDGSDGDHPAGRQSDRHGSARVTFDVAVVDRLNNPVRKAGVEVSLGQVLYTSEGLFPGLASINGMPEGQSPVTALTDASGVAHFSARAVQQQPHEVFFQAWLQAPFPHGYSGLVSVHFQVAAP